MGSILMHGSKERLQRIVARSNGDWLPDKQFEITMQTYNRKGNGLCFVFCCIWETQADGIRIFYRVRPAFFTVLIPLIAFVFFTALSIVSVMDSGLPALAAFLIPAIFVIAWVRQMNECIRDFRKFFDTPTC